MGIGENSKESSRNVCLRALGQREEGAFSGPGSDG